MNLSILLTDFIDTKGMLKTYRFIPINQYNRIVVDRLSDICTDVKGNTDKDVGLLRVYNSDKCQLQRSLAFFDGITGRRTSYRAGMYK